MFLCINGQNKLKAMDEFMNEQEPCPILQVVRMLSSRLQNVEDMTENEKVIAAKALLAQENTDSKIP